MRRLRRGPTPASFAGLGTWVDIYDAPAYRSPDATAARIAARGVRTVYVETANDRSTVDVVKPKALGLFVDALKARGIRVVAWYLPGFVKPAVDVRRTRAMLSFRTPRARRSTASRSTSSRCRLKSVGLRTTRLLALSRILRAEAGETPVAAITYPSRGLRAPPDLVARLPLAGADGLVDAWIPMTYTGDELPRLRRDLRLRGALAAPAAHGRRARRSRSTPPAAWRTG